MVILTFVQKAENYVWEPMLLYISGYMPQEHVQSSTGYENLLYYSLKSLQNHPLGTWGKYLGEFYGAAILDFGDDAKNIIKRLNFLEGEPAWPFSRGLHRWIFHSGYSPENW